MNKVSSFSADCQNLFAVKGSVTVEQLAGYIASQTGERVSHSGNGYRIGNHAQGGSIAVSEKDGVAVWYDFADDGAKGTVIDAIMHYEGIKDTKEAAVRACAIAGVDPSVFGKADNTDKRKPRKALLTTDWEKVLRAGLESVEFKAIMAKRGLNPLIPHFNKFPTFGFWGSTNPRVKINEKANLVPRSLVVWNDAQTWIKVIPLDAGGKRDRDTKGRNITQTGGGGYWEPQPLDTGAPVYLCEGEFDALAMRMVGLQAMPWKPEGTQITRIKALSSPILAYDGDEQGEKYARKVLSMCPGAIDISTIWDGDDPNDFIREHEDALTQINEAVEKARKADDGKDDGEAANLARAKRVFADNLDKNGKIKWTTTTLDEAISPAIIGCTLAHDVFTQADVIKKSPKFAELARDKACETWEPVTDADINRAIPRALEQSGFVGKDSPHLSNIVSAIASQSEIHSFRNYLDSVLPEYDGEDYSDFFTRYAPKTPDTPWNRAVARHLFSALYARATNTNPAGVKVDVVTCLLGQQKAGKSELVKALALDPSYFDTLSVTAAPADRIRKMQGKVIMEIPELGGITKKDYNEVKDFITCQVDSYVPKYREKTKSCPRSCVFVLTTNEQEFLTDPTGNRRFAPVEIVGEIDLERLQADVPKLWAYGKHLFEQNGVMWQDLCEMQEAETKKHLVEDPWQEPIRQWLIDKAASTVTYSAILSNCLMIMPDRQTPKDKQRVRRIMYALGYSYGTQRITDEEKRRFGDWFKSDVVKAFRLTKKPEKEDTVEPVFSDIVQLGEVSVSKQELDSFVASWNLSNPGDCISIADVLPVQTTDRELQNLLAPVY